MADLISKSALVNAIKNSTCHWAERMWKQVVCDVISNQPTTSEAEIRAKAIDEFEEKCFEKLFKKRCSLDGLDIYEIAEELKGGSRMKVKTVTLELTVPADFKPCSPTCETKCPFGYQDEYGDFVCNTSIGMECPMMEENGAKYSESSKFCEK